MGDCLTFIIGLFSVGKGHFFQQPLCMANLFYDEQQVPDVQRDVAAELGIEGEVAHGAFPNTVEVDTYQFAVGIEDGTA